MANVLICDTDFLSSFIKIDRMELVRQFYRVDEIFIPRGVYHELAETDLIVWLDKNDWVQEYAVDRKQAEQLRQRVSSRAIIGIGESEAITLAKVYSESLLLISDRAARRIAAHEGVSCVDIPGFLLACKHAGYLTVIQIGEIIADLEEKDYYKLPQKIRALLLQ